MAPFSNIIKRPFKVNFILGTITNQVDTFTLFQKVVKLHQKLGKPIPEPSPLKAPEAKDTTKENGDKKAGAGNKGAQGKPSPKKMAAPKITFVGGTKLTSTGIVKSDAAALPGAVSGNSNAVATSGNEVEMEEGQCFTVTLN